VSDERIHLSPPDMSEIERRRLVEAFDSNWIAPVGPDLTAFETSLGAWTDREHVVALSSGTAALHLALLLQGVSAGDEVLVPTMTFVATANAVTQAGGVPTFIDSARSDGNMDPDLVAEVLADRARLGRLPAAVVTVDLYGQCADYGRLLPLCEQYGVPVVADAAEALGARRSGQRAGSTGQLAALSFNGNKIITTGGGGALAGSDAAVIDRARYLATQARVDAPHYEHVDAGFNYRLSNLLAAVGRAQLERLPELLQRRSAINERYEDALAAIDGICFWPVATESEPNHWLTVIMVDPDRTGATATELRLTLDARNIEARPAWKPMHLQPLFAEAATVGGAVSEDFFEHGLCLPSGSSLNEVQQDRIVEILLATLAS